MPANVGPVLNGLTVPVLVSFPHAWYWNEAWNIAGPAVALSAKPVVATPAAISLNS
jgi:hypothetical protein